MPHDGQHKGNGLVYFFSVECVSAKNKRPLNAARTTMQASWIMGSRWTESGWNEWSGAVPSETGDGV